MYKAKESFTTKDYDIRKDQILEDDFTTQDEITDFLNAGYIEEYDGSIDIIENGTYDVREYDEAEVNVQGEVNLQTKNVTITENTTTEITPSTGYNGLSKVNVTTNVAISDIPKGIMMSAWDSTTGMPTKYKIIDTQFEWGMFNADGSNNENIRSFLKYMEELNIIPTNQTITTIPEYCFYKCLNLKTINIPNTTTTIKARAFYSCDNLDIDITNLPLTSIGLNNMGYGGNGETFRNCFKLKCSSFPAELNINGTNNFFQCRSITITTVPDTWTTISEATFYGCTSIPKITLPNVKTIYAQAFYQCTGMKYAYLPKATTFNNSAFYQCTSLEKVWIGSDVTSNGLYKNTFQGSTSLNAIYINLPRATVELFTNYQYAFMNDTSKTGIIVCNDDVGFMSENDFKTLIDNA